MTGSINLGDTFVLCSQIRHFWCSVVLASALEHVSVLRGKKIKAISLQFVPSKSD